MSSVRFKHGAFHVLYRDADGVQRSEKAGVTEADARKRKAEIDLMLLSGRNPADSSIRFDAAWLEWRAHKLSSSRPIARSTLADYDSIYRCYLGPFFGNLRLRDINSRVVGQFQMDVRRQGISAVRLGKVVVPLRACLRWHSRTGAFPYDMTLWFDTPSPAADERRVLSFDQAERLIGATPAYYRPFIACAVYTGMRLGELRALTWSDVDLEGGLVRVRRTMDGSEVKSYTKTRDSRSVGVPSHLIEVLREWKDVCPASVGSLVFPQPHGAPIDPNNFRRRVFKPALVEAGLDSSFRLHDLRHTAASWYVRAGATVVDLMGVFGWRQLQTALRYIHMLDTPVSLAEKLSRAREEGLGGSS